MWDSCFFLFLQSSISSNNNAFWLALPGSNAFTQPQVQLKNIVSPGLFVSYGFPNAPFSANVGYQLAPSLQVDNMTGQTTTVANQGRVSISLLVDIPLFNLWLKGKRIVNCMVATRL